MKFKEFIHKMVNKMEETMFPDYVCPFCSTETPDGVVCGECEKLKIKPNFCIKCGAHIPENSNVCIQCKDYERIFDQNFSVYTYTDKVAAAVLKLKFSGAKYLASNFAKILAEKFNEINTKVDVITYVPSTKKRIKQRGYNQSEEMAKELAKLVKIPCLDILEKVKETAHQTELSRKERLENLIGSIDVADKWQVKGKSILIIDDVFTTGSTMSACAKALKKAGAESVYGLTLAKTEIIV